MATVLLTPSIVTDTTCPSGKRKIDLFDTHCRGLVLEIRISGGRTYYLRYQDKRGRTRLSKLANADDITLSQARTLADKGRNKIAMGNDPCDEKSAIKQVPTFQDFAKTYLEFVQGYKRSWQTDESLIRNHLLPRFGKKYLDEISRDDIVKMHRSRLAEGAKPGTANRLLIMMRYIFNLAIRWEVPSITTNPSKGIPLYEENNKKERYLSTDEAQRLYEQLCKSDSSMLKYIIMMLILTGARKREVLDAKWVDFDLSNRRWRIPMTKTGKARHVPLSDGAMQILTTLPRITNCPWVFPNTNTGKPFENIFHSWNTARKRAGLSDVRIHDLRHSFASLLVNSGRTLYEVQQLLGHTQVKTTQRYAHLSHDTLLDAANAASLAVSRVMLPVLKQASFTVLAPSQAGTVTTNPKQLAA